MPYVDTFDAVVPWCRVLLHGPRSFDPSLAEGRPPWLLEDGFSPVLI